MADGQVRMNARDIGATIGALGELTKSGESLRAGARLTQVGSGGFWEDRRGPPVYR